ncbi:MAG: class I SAM-dependent methyltransferase [Patescibacteria group bacterium]|jgi:ubiquinone/menaquinone biosynthesis C-methylase UbiE
MSNDDSRKISFGQDGESTLDRIIKMLRFNRIKRNIPSQSCVLDLGCGFRGDFLVALSNHIKSGLGIDMSVSSEVTADNISLKTGIVDKRLDVKDDSMDVVTSLALIEHLDDPKTFLSESHRVLKSGGTLLLTTPSIKAKPILELLAFRLKVISRVEIADHKRYYSKETLENALVDAGFDKSKVSILPFQFGNNLFARAEK